jgi:hypothetical protein
MGGWNGLATGGCCSAFLNRPVMRLGGGIVGVAVLYVMFVGPFEDWTKQTIQDRAATIAEWRTERVHP